MTRKQAPPPGRSPGGLIRSQSGGMRGLGDYINPLYHQQTLPPEYRGPQVAPVTGPPVACTMEQLCAVLQQMPAMMFNEFHNRGVLRPREAVNFLAASDGWVDVTSDSDYTVVASYTMPEKFSGFLTDFTVAVTPDSSSDTVLWAISVGDNIISAMNGQKLVGSTLAELIPMMMELTATRTVTLQAILTSGSPAVQVAGRLIGWQENLNPLKPFGSVSASGLQ